MTERARRVLAVGLGSIGRRHLENLRALGPLEVTAFRRRGRDAAALRERFALSEVGSLEEGLERRPDFVLIANPTALHLPAAAAAARAGIPFFVEKPLSDSWQGVEELCREVAARRLTSAVGFHLRFHPALRRMHELLREGGLGRVLWLRAEVGQHLPDWHPGEDYREGYSAHRELGGGALLDLIHELDYARLLGGPVREVTALLARVSDLRIDTEDVAELLLRCEDGAIASVHMDYVARPYRRRCTVACASGSLEWDDAARELRVFDAASGTWRTESFQAVERNDAFRAEMAHFLACLDGRERPLVDVHEGARVLQVALAARRSAAEGRAVTLEGAL